MQNINTYHFIWLFIFLNVPFHFSCSSDQKKEPAAMAGPRKKQPIQVEAFTVRAKPLAETLEVPGTLLPFEETEIRSEISGRLVKMNIREGGVVKQGDVLAKLFDEDLQAQLKKLEVQLNIAKKTFERQQELLKIQGISQQEVDLSELQVKNIEADIELVKVDISKTEIRAPYAGKLGLRNISPGAYITPSNVLSTIRQLNTLKLDFTVPEKYGDLFGAGRGVKFSIAGSNKVYSATVLATEAEIATDTRSLKVRAVVQQNNSSLIPGAFANVKFSIGGNDSSLIIPTQSVIPKARTKEVVIFRNGKPIFQTVETGIRDEQYIQVLEGLEEGDTVVTTGLLTIREDSELVLSKID
ncbi:MAG: efflux RND transporter periplasmic adaptor subunit [Saprospiraceae bacterium]